MSDDEDSYNLLVSIARSEGLKATYGKQKSYVPLFRHPLPVSDTRFIHENVLVRVLSCKIEEQAVAAISLNCAWSLEEVFMRGGPSVLKNSFPIHAAVQANSVDCIMVLLNIGIDLNGVNNLGFTALALARSLGRLHIVKLLEENHAKMFEDQETQPAQTGLEVYPESRVKQAKNTKLNSFLNLPSAGDTY